jgi:release factor glutamine methyltransferase
VRELPGADRRSDPPVALRRLPPVRTLEDWRRAARVRLAEAGIDSAAAEADLIARHVLGLRRVDLPLQRARVLTPAERRRLSRLLRRRGTRVPLQYLLGEVDFWGLSIRVTPDVLVPRPETEGLVERVLSFLGDDPEGTVVDVGTGSGAIALAVASACPRIHVWASDLSPGAVRVARGNARRMGLEGRLRIFAGDLLEPFAGRVPPGPVRVLVSNPPYIAPADRQRLAPEVVMHEPSIALFAPERGLGVIRRLIDGATEFLPGGGLLALEIGEDLGAEVLGLLIAAGAWREVRIERDLAGRDRYALALRTR